MLRLLNPNTFTQNLKPVSSMITTTKNGDFHEEGLFSEDIFGPVGSKDRRIVFSFIELHGFIIHPSAYRILMQLDRKVEKFISTEESFILDKDGRLEINSKGVTGMKEFMKLFPQIQWRGETELRDKLIKFVKREEKNGTIFVDKIPVVPPDLRPAVQGSDGNWMIDALNDVYISVMRRASQLRSSGSGPLYDLLNYSLHISVMDHDDYIRSKIGKKHGIIRDQMLGKRIDFSGRAVITPDPNLKINECGVPLRLAISLFEPFIMHRLLYSGRVDKDVLANGVKEFTGMDLSVEAVKRVMKGIKEGDDIPKDLYELFFEQTKISMMGRVVVVKRDPVLHTQSYLAYNPVLHRGDTLLMSTTQVGVHNADFDGDTMAIYHPLTTEAQEEARTRMMKLTSGTSSGEFIFGLSKEMWAGMYIITKDKKPTNSPISVTNDDLVKATEPYVAVKYRGQVTTMGKAIINSCFPQDMPFLQVQATKKTIGAMIEKIYEKHGDEVIKVVVDRLKDVGFKWATIMAPSMNLDSFVLPASVIKIKEKLKTATPEEAQVLIEEAQEILEKHLDNTGFGDLANSGSTKGWSQPMQILVAKGVIADPDGNVLDPISGSFADGLSNREYFDASQGARKGIIDRVINTADTGYMSRKLAYLLNTVELDRMNKDCRTTRTIAVKLDKILIGRFKGRYVIKNDKLMLFDDAGFKTGDICNLRTPIFCTSPKICHTCYGKLLERHNTPYVGILAAQIIGERGTQLIMKCSDGLVHYNNNLVAFEDLWNDIDSPILTEYDKETKEFKSQVFGKNGLVNMFKIQRHNPTDKMLFISTKNGHTLICQKNHPLFIKKNPIHDRWLNEKCRLIGDEIHTEIHSTRKNFKTSDNELIEIEAKDLKQYDSIWIDNSIAINNENSIMPELNGYICGIYLAEGSKLGKERQTKGLGITQEDGPIKDRIFEHCYDYEKFKMYRDGVTIWDNTEKMSTIVYGNYAWEKRLRPDFINFDKQWLKDFLAGVIDGDGTVFNNSSTCCRIATSSYYLVQQLKAICLKLGYKMNTTIVTGNKEGRIGAEQKRINFSCDIRFREYDNLKSIKLEKNGDIIPCKLRVEKDIKGFDIITVVKEIWKWDYPVYDIQTETSEYMLGFVQNHNTFHTGGGVTLVKRDMLGDIINNDPMSGLEK